MSRQILFHMLPQDLKDLLDFVHERDPVVVTAYDADSSTIRSQEPDPNKKENLCLWNQSLVPTLTRMFIPESTVGPYYRVDDRLPLLELSTSLQTSWQGYPALLQGRIYGRFENQSTGLEHWFRAISAWIRKHYVRSPVNILRGYLAPFAREWYEKGGYLLPMFLPPDTIEWRSVIEIQHGLLSGRRG
jgi:hypothetical protein